MKNFIFKKENFYLRIFRKDESGWMMVFMIVLLPLALAALAFVIDLGHSYKVKEKLRHAADAALIAAGKVYLERSDLKNGLNDDPHDDSPEPGFPNGVKTDEDEVRKLMQKLFLYNLKTNGFSSAQDPGFIGESNPMFTFTPNIDSETGVPDGSYQIGISAKYTLSTFYGFAFALLPNGRDSSFVNVSIGSKYNIAPKTKIILGITMDMSNSVKPDRFNALKAGMKKAVNRLNDGSYIMITTFHNTWAGSEHVFVPMSKIVSQKTGASGVPEKTRTELELIVDGFQKNSQFGTYMQGGIYRIRKEITGFISANPDLENWGNYRKGMIILADGRANKRSSRSDGKVPPWENPSPPYEPQEDYTIDLLPYDAGGWCGSRSTANPLTAYEADHARRNGIIVMTICTSNCNAPSGEGQQDRQTMKRIANAPLINEITLEDESPFLLWHDINKDAKEGKCFVPYLLKADEDKTKDPNPFILPASMNERDLYIAVDDEKIGERLELLIGKLTKGANQIIE
jgi:Putative Flp pilus-assembly TadE/G-like